MQKHSKILMVIGILAGIVAVAYLIAWWGGRPSRLPTGSSAETRPAGGFSEESGTPGSTSDSDRTGERSGNTNSAQLAAGGSSASGSTNLIANWEDKLDDILGSEEDDTNKVKELFAIFQRLPSDGQEEVAQHLSNLVADENYAPLGQLLHDAKLPESVLDVLMGDALNRPNSVKLPLLLDIAGNADHPKADEAKDLISLYLEEDDPAKWPQKLQEWLKENPD